MDVAPDELTATRRRVLLAESDPGVRATLSRWLSEHGYDVIEARDGTQVIDLYQATAPDVVVLDRQLDGRDGYSVCQEIQRLEEAGLVPVLLTGASATEDELEAAFRAGAQDFLKKPLMADELCARVEHALHSSSLRRELWQQNMALESEVDERQRELQRTNRQLKIQLLSQQTLFDLSQQLNSSIDIDEQINMLLLTVMGQLGVDMAALFTMGSDESNIALHAAKGVHPEGISKVLLHEERPFLHYIEAHREPTMLRDLPLGVSTGPHLTRLIELGLVCGCPIQATGSLSGLLVLGAKINGRPMTSQDFAMLASLATSAGIAMEKADLFRKLQETYLATIQSLMAAMEARDTYTRGHTARVARYSLAIGREMHFSKEALQDLKFGSTLHDIGKIGILDQILNKPSQLTEHETEVMRQHPELGDRILRKIEFLRNARTIVRHHHERIDGKGYPDGLRGEEISLGARIVAVADSFDAMTSKRTYSEGMGLEDAIVNLADKINAQFDPDVVEVFTRLLRTGGVPVPTWMKP